MLPRKPLEKEVEVTSLYNLIYRLSLILLTREGIVALLLVTIIFSFIGGTGYTLKTVGPEMALYFRTSAESTSALKGNIVLLAENLAINTKRLEQQQRQLDSIDEQIKEDAKQLNKLKSDGTEPVQQLLATFKDAKKMMEPAIESRMRAEKLLSEILEELRKKG